MMNSITVASSPCIGRWDDLYSSAGRTLQRYRKGHSKLIPLKAPKSFFFSAASVAIAFKICYYNWSGRWSHLHFRLKGVATQILSDNFMFSLSHNFSRVPLQYARVKTRPACLTKMVLTCYDIGLQLDQ